MNAAMPAAMASVTRSMATCKVISIGAAGGNSRHCRPLSFSLDELAMNIRGAGAGSVTASEYLMAVYKGAAEHWPEKLPDKVQNNCQ
jgi:hypothetical protein